MKILNLFFAIILFILTSCQENMNNEKLNRQILEPKENYTLYLLIKNLDTVKINKEISQNVYLEKFDFLPQNKISVKGDWTIIKLDERMNPYMIFNFIGIFTEAKYGTVIGIGINKKNRGKSFYSITGEKTYIKSGGEYLVGRLEDSANFKYYIFSDDTMNFVFESINEKELNQNMYDFLKNKGFNESFFSEIGINI